MDYDVMLCKCVLFILGIIQFAVCKIDCDFETSDCGWTNQNGGKFKGALWERRRGPTPTQETGPNSGHGGPDSGYMFMDGSKWRNDAQAVLSSPYIYNSQGLTECYYLSFWYFMAGEDIASLSVLLYSKETRMKEALWHQGVPKGGRWNPGRVQFTQAGHFKIYFVAKRGDGRKSDIAIDDINLTESSCQGSNAASGYYNCYNGRQISSDHFCDGVDQCGDGSDEMVPLCTQGESLSSIFNLSTILGLIICTTLIFLLVTVIILICHRHKYAMTTLENDEYSIPGRIPGFNAPLNPTEITTTQCYSNSVQEHNGLVPCDNSLNTSQCVEQRSDVPPSYDSIILPLDRGTCDVVKVANTEEGAGELASMICSQSAPQNSTSKDAQNSPEQEKSHLSDSIGISMFTTFDSSINNSFINKTGSNQRHHLTRTIPSAPPREEDDDDDNDSET